LDTALLDKDGAVMERGFFLKDAHQELRTGLSFKVLPRSHAFFDPFGPLDQDEGADLAFGEREDRIRKTLSPLTGLGFLAETQGAQGVKFLKGLTDLGLEKDDEENHEHLPEDLEDPGGQEKAPGLSKRKDHPKSKQPDKGLERLGSSEPKIKMIGEHSQEKDVEHILDS
jgi:hypothetical protein